MNIVVRGDENWIISSIFTVTILRAFGRNPCKAQKLSPIQTTAQCWMKSSFPVICESSVREFLPKSPNRCFDSSWTITNIAQYSLFSPSFSTFSLLRGKKKEKENRIARKISMSSNIKSVEKVFFFPFRGGKNRFSLDSFQWRHRVWLFSRCSNVK